MKNVGQMYGHQMPAIAGQAGGRPQEKGLELSQEWRALAVRMHKLNKKKGIVGTRRFRGQEMWIITTAGD